MMNRPKIIFKLKRGWVTFTCVLKTSCKILPSLKRMLVDVVVKTILSELLLK